MTSKVFVCSLVSFVLLSGCSSVEDRKIASGSFSYLEDKPGQRVEVPEGLDSPNFSDSYKLPSLGENAPTDIVGQQLSVLSPSLVLPLVTGSHIEEGSKNATVWFDKVDDSQPLDDTIWNSLKTFLESKNIGIQSFDKSQQRLVTDWMVIKDDEEDHWYNWNSSERTVSKRFEFNLELKPHGRIASLSVALIDYKETTGDAEAITRSNDERRQEVDILNQVIDNYEREVRLATAQLIRKIRQGLVMELGFNEDGEPAYVIDAEYDVAWPRLLLVLRKLGFDVKDYDKSNGLLFVKYNGSEGSWWSKLWSKDENALDLDTKEYRMRMVDIGSKSSLTLMDDESKAFTVDKLTDLFNTFSRTMAADNLDI